MRKWTPEERAKQAEIMRRDKPWTYPKKPKVNLVPRDTTRVHFHPETGVRMNPKRPLHQNPGLKAALEWFEELGYVPHPREIQKKFGFTKERAYEVPRKMAKRGWIIKRPTYWVQYYLKGQNDGLQHDVEREDQE